MKVTAMHGEGGLPGLPSPYEDVTQSALHYSRRELEVVPVGADKRPLIKWATGGLRCPIGIRKAFAPPGVAGVAILTGHRSGLVVIDADGPEAEGRAKELLGEAGILTLQFATPRGKHFFFRHPGGHVPNSASKIAPGIDARGDGGYVCVPPGPGRRCLNPEADLLPLPLDIATTNCRRERSEVVTPDLHPVAEEEATAVLLREGAAEKVRTAQRGQRNHALNREAFGLGPLLSAGRLDFGATWDLLASAALGNGLDEREVRATLRSGLPGGVAAHPATDLSGLLDGVERFIKRFVIFPSDHEPAALALWVGHSHSIEAAETTGYIHISAADAISGKTRTLETVEPVVRGPLRTSNISVAALVHLVDKQASTLLVDEVDAIFNRTGDLSEALRGILNDGYRKGGGYIRMVGEGSKQEPRKFGVFGAKALTGIGKLPDTLATRSIPIRLRRKLREESVDRFRIARAERDGAVLREQLAAWAEHAIPSLGDAQPALPDELTDRQQDMWEPLLAISDLAGGGWPERARTAAVALHGGAAERTAGEQLLAAIRDIFDEAGTDKVPTRALIEGLVKRDDGPWAIWWGRDTEHENLTGPGARLSRALRPYGICSKDVRADDKVQRGYERADFEDAWLRNLPDEGTLL